jgi:hypothetical protein
MSELRRLELPLALPPLLAIFLRSSADIAAKPRLLLFAIAYLLYLVSMFHCKKDALTVQLGF